MSPIDERLKSLNVVPDVMPPVIDGYVPAFAPFTMENAIALFASRRRPRAKFVS
jgi:hypothetical protein